MPSFQSRRAVPEGRLRPACAQRLGRHRPVAARFRTITAAAMARTATRTSHAMELSASATRHLLARGGRGAARALGQAVSNRSVPFSRAFEVAKQTFWRIVYAAAEYAAFVATRRLNRTRT